MRIRILQKALTNARGTGFDAPRRLPLWPHRYFHTCDPEIILEQTSGNT